MTPRGKKTIGSVPINPQVDNDSSYASRIELKPAAEISPLTIYNAHKAYTFKWCNKNKMANGRRGIWITVKKDHPHFKDMRVEMDITPDANFFTCGDLILCQCRKETAESMKKALSDKIRRRDKAMEKKDTETLARLSKGDIREKIRTLDRHGE